MAEIKKGGLSLNLGFLQLQADISEDDRQCAWELYSEICTRISLTGKRENHDCKNFSGEVLSESLDSVHAFFRETRGIMRKFPVGRLGRNKTKHLGVLINDLIVHVLRPFLEKWQADYRHWWKQAEADEYLRILTPFERQKKYPKYKSFLKDWRNMRLLMRELQLALVKVYALVDVDAAAKLLPKRQA